LYGQSLSPSDSPGRGVTDREAARRGNGVLATAPSAAPHVHALVNHVALPARVLHTTWQGVGERSRDQVWHLCSAGGDAPNGLSQRAGAGLVATCRLISRRARYAQSLVAVTPFPGTRGDDVDAHGKTLMTSDSGKEPRRQRWRPSNCTRRLLCETLRARSVTRPGPRGAASLCNDR
jgi:hypothetical protein